MCMSMSVCVWLWLETRSFCADVKFCYVRARARAYRKCRTSIDTRGNCFLDWKIGVGEMFLFPAEGAN